jgi:hypothetical protein
MKNIVFTLFLYGTILPLCAQIQNVYTTGAVWKDVEGKPIEAHGGGILQVGNTYYWYGENHSLGVGNKTGISCYSSTDLFNWRNEGVVLPKQVLPEMFRDSGVCERPKVLYNKKTRKYVMWMHLDGRNYTMASAGVAVADKPNGKFKFLGYKRPIQYDYGYKLARGPEYDPNEKLYGNTFRDMNLFQDKDGKAYVLYAAEDNATMYCVRLNESYTDIEQPAIKGKTWERILPEANREAPAPFVYKGKYYLITSGLTGWAPNAAEYAIADNMLGPWKRMGNPCVGLGAATTFNSQSTFVIPAPGLPEGSFIFMADRWDSNELEKSRLIWLPFVIQADGSFILNCLDHWNMQLFDMRNGDEISKPQAKLAFRSDSMVKTIEWTKVEGAALYKVLKNGKVIGETSGTSLVLPQEISGKSFNYTVTAINLMNETSLPSNSVQVDWKYNAPVYLSDIEADSWKQGFGSLMKDLAINQSLININGSVYQKGLGTHAYSEVVYTICGNYSRFTAMVGVDHYPSFTDVSSMQFEVYGDGKLLFQSKLMKVTTTAEKIDISVKGINELKLVVTDGGDGNHYDHADWAIPLLK